MRLNKRGFTLIEIIVVVVILAVLLAVAVPSVLKYINTADEAPALTECHAIVTASHKKVIDNYSKSREDIHSLSSDDIKWIEDFVNEGGTIQGSIIVKKNEVTRLIYLASNGLYVLYDKNKNPEYSIISKEDASNDRIVQLDSMLAEYTDRTIELGTGKNSLDRNVLINELANNNELVKVDDELIKKNNIQKNELYWKPYYLGDKPNNPSLILFANENKSTSGNQWSASLIYANGKMYKCNNVSVANYHKNYLSIEDLENHIKANKDSYTEIEITS